MAKVTKRFAKGQTVFFACLDMFEVASGERNGRLEIVHAGAVITRTVDACGAKQVTFEDHGNDSTFGRSMYANSDQLFNTAEEAFEYLKNSRYVEVIAKKVYSDANREWYDEIVQGRTVFISEQK